MNREIVQRGLFYELAPRYKAYIQLQIYIMQRASINDIPVQERNAACMIIVSVRSLTH